MESYALLIGATLSAGTVLAIAALGLLINEKAGIVNLGVSMAAATATVVCACGVIGTSWLAHRPALAYTLFAVSAGSYAWAWASGSRRREAEREAGRAADAHARRSTNGAGDGGGDSPGGDSPREGRDGGPEPDYTHPHLD